MLTRRALISIGLPAFGIDWLPSEDPKLIQEMVTVSHGNLARVRELLDLKPALVRATIDWGFGDWETSLGGASHVGNRAIAELLISRGAEPTIFSAAMLGQLDTVKAMIAAQPGVQRQLGPHGIPLLNHARAGGEPAKAVLEYLTSLGDADNPTPTEPITAEQKQSLTGTYTFGSGERDHFIVNIDKNQLGINRPGAPARRNLNHAGNMEFFPAGAPSVRIVFEQQGGKITAMRINQLRATKAP